MTGSVVPCMLWWAEEKEQWRERRDWLPEQMKKPEFPGKEALNIMYFSITLFQFSN